LCLSRAAMVPIVAAFDAKSVKFCRKLRPKPDRNLTCLGKGIVGNRSGLMVPQLAGPFLSLFPMASGRIAYVVACEIYQLLDLDDQVSFRCKQTYI
jgi:hypothetical protein